jgi:hypothetical protein
MVGRSWKKCIGLGALACRSKIGLGFWGVLASASIFAQAPQSAPPAGAAAMPQSKAVALVSDLCPTVRAGGLVSLDWYPGFDLEGIVTGIRSFTLSFSPLVQNGATPARRSMVYLGGRGRSFAAPTGNAYYHVEFPVPRNTAPGVYTLVDAHATALTPPEYQGDPLVMTNSPVDGRFCITITAYSRAAVQDSANDSHD